MPPQGHRDDGLPQDLPADHGTRRRTSALRRTSERRSRHRRNAATTSNVYFTSLLSHRSLIYIEVVNPLLYS